MNFVHELNMIGAKITQIIILVCIYKYYNMKNKSNFAKIERMDLL